MPSQLLESPGKPHCPSLKKSHAVSLGDRLRVALHEPTLWHLSPEPGSACTCCTGGHAGSLACKAYSARSVTLCCTSAWEKLAPKLFSREKNPETKKKPLKL